MPEPEGTATLVGEVVPGVFRFKIHHSQINFEADSFAVVHGGKAVLIDPLPMTGGDLGGLGEIEAICLTASCHERSAWRYQKQLGVLVYAPEHGVDFEGTPDRWYKEGDMLPGGLKAIHSPGPTDAHYSFYLSNDTGVVFCADLLTNAGAHGLGFVPGEYQDEPDRTRDSVRRLLEMDFEVLCPNHGDPIVGGAHHAISEALDRDRKTGGG